MVPTKIFKKFSYLPIGKNWMITLKYVHLALDAQLNNTCPYTTLKCVIQNSEKQKGFIYPVFQNISIILQQRIMRS